MVEFDVAIVEARVRFPDDAHFLSVDPTGAGSRFPTRSPTLSTYQRTNLALYRGSVSRIPYTYVRTREYSSKEGTSEIQLLNSQCLLITSSYAS